MWAYRARDAVATAMHGTWGSFWIGWGVLVLADRLGVHAPPALGTNVSFAWWFLVLTAVTVMGALASLGRSLSVFAVLGLLAVGSGFSAAAFYGAGAWAFILAGWVLAASAVAARYTAGAMMLASGFGRTILPIGHLKAAHNVPGRKPERPVEYPLGMPGAKVGQ